METNLRPYILTLFPNGLYLSRYLSGIIFLSLAFSELAFAQNTVSSAAQSSGYLSVATNRHWLELQGKPRELVKKPLDRMCTLEGVNQYLKRGEKSKSKQSKAEGYNINLKPFKL